MASLIDMSLEDIIKKKREKIKNNNAGNNTIKKSGAVKKNLAVTDARMKIISKKRTKITDAREKLAEMAKYKDARLKLQQMRQKKMAVNQLSMGWTFNKNMSINNTKWTRNTSQDERVFLDQSRQVRSQPYKPSMGIHQKKQNFPKKFLERRAIGLGQKPHIQPIVRTVENDMHAIAIDDDEEDDPMGDDHYKVPKSSQFNRKANFNLKIIAHNNDVRETSSFSRSSSRRAPVGREKSPPRLPSILKKRPMASIRTEKKSEKAIEQLAAAEYRIIVSNLRNSVTGGDIQELFGDVGGMTESRLVRPGTAEVLYKSQEDAQRAVDLYHNRQLDGQPMNCLLVTPRPNTVASRSTGSGSGKPSLPPSTNSNVEPDLSTFHKVLFSNF